MKITRLDACQTLPIHMEGIRGASKQVPIGREDGAPNFSIRVFTLEPAGHTPHHSHPSEHLNYILEGSGELLEPHEKHQFRNTGDSPLVFMCMVPKEYE